MGDRGNIKITFECGQSIHLYTHWAGTRIPEMLSSALRRGQDRWNDESYLARIIFNQMTKGIEMNTTGAGIHPHACDNEHAIPEVVIGTRCVIYQGKTWSFREWAECPPVEQDEG